MLLFYNIKQYWPTDDPDTQFTKLNSTLLRNFSPLMFGKLTWSLLFDKMFLKSDKFFSQSVNLLIVSVR